MKTGVLNAIGVVAPELQKAVTAPDHVPMPEEVAEQITDVYMNQALNRQNLVNTVMLNSSLDWYRNTVNESSEAYERDLAAAQGTLNANTGAVIHGAKTFGEALRDSISEMAVHGLTGFAARFSNL